MSGAHEAHVIAAAIMNGEPRGRIGAPQLRRASELALLYGCGLRRSEVVALLLDHYREGVVTGRSGKGRKERIVYCPAGGREAIVAWLARRGAWPGALLAPVAKGGRIQLRSMTAQAMLLLVSGQPADPPEAHPSCE